jgi:hypothetical protein
MGWRCLASNDLAAMRCLALTGKKTDRTRHARCSQYWRRVCSRGRLIMGRKSAAIRASHGVGLAGRDAAKFHPIANTSTEIHRYEHLLVKGRSVAATLRPALTLASTMVVVGCSALSLVDFKPPDSDVKPCTSARMDYGVTVAGIRKFAFVLPQFVATEWQTDGTLSRSDAGASVALSFKEYRDRMGGFARSKVPDAIWNHDVTQAFFGIMVTTSARGMLTAYSRDAKTTDQSVLQAQYDVDRYSVPDSLTHLQINDFARMLNLRMLRPTINTGAAKGAKDEDQFTQYFTDYYSGKFVDRFGQSIASSQSMSGATKSSARNLGRVQAASDTSTSTPAATPIVSDADISASFNFLVEYLLDQMDHTPVLGDTQSPSQSTTYYPAATKKEPTASVVDPKKYAYLSESPSCGLTRDNAQYLGLLAQAAGDTGATVGGLLLNSFGGASGGVTLGLGALGKFSLGDNQTLSVVGKAVATRLVKRWYFAHHYWALQGAAQGTPTLRDNGTFYPSSLNFHFAD